MDKISRRNFIKLGVIPFLGTSYYEAISLNRIQYEFHELYLPSWEADGLKIAFLTDFHIKGSIEAARAIKSIEMAVSQKPDLILFGGDFVDAKQAVHFSHIQRVLDVFNSISIPCYGVYGNHDYSFFQKLKLFEKIKKSKLKILKNELAEIHNIHIIGVDDPYTGHACFTFFDNKKLSHSTVCLMHTPDSVGRTPFVSLQLSGHGHGGQICLPFGIPLIRHVGAEKYISGYYPKAKYPLYVSRGIGTTSIDLRLFCPPEVSVLTLKKSF